MKRMLAFILAISAAISFFSLNIYAGKICDSGKHKFCENPKPEYLMTPATCTEKAVYYKSCSVCGYCGYEIFEYGKPFGHSFCNKPDRAYLKSFPTCTKRAVYFESCSVCGEAGPETFEYGDYAKHDFVEDTDLAYLKTEATCISRAIYKKSCSVCGKVGDETFEYGDFAEHNFCRNPDAEFLKSPATCVNSAVFYVSCSVCKEKSEEIFAYGNTDKTNHIGGTYLSGKVDPTCSSKGYSGDIYCNSCNSMLKAGKTLSEKPHDYQNEVINPTVGKRGYTLHTCKNCKYSYKDNYTIYNGENAPVISVSSPVGVVGGKVRVEVFVKNNPGIVSMNLKLNYDENILRLTEISDCGIFGKENHKPTLKYLNWENDTDAENITANGDIVILTFEILKNAPFGKTPITVSYDYDNCDVCNAAAENVAFAIESGYVDVSDKKTGDVSGDGTVNGYDRLLLTRWLAKWREVLDGGIDETAADINCDGKINGLDRLILTRYLAHWEDYDLPYIK